MHAIQLSPGRKLAAKIGTLFTATILGALVLLSIERPAPMQPPGNGRSAAPVPLYTGEMLLLDHSTKMITPREAFTATVIPDGRVLVVGGRDRQGKLLSSAEAFDPQDATFETVPKLQIAARAEHTTTLLTDGRLVVIGGRMGDGRVSKTVEVVDPVTWEVAGGPSISVARRGHTATLLPSGAVVIQGGVDANGAAPGFAELVDIRSAVATPYTLAMREENEVRFRAAADTIVVETLPHPEQRDVDLEEFVAVRFSKPIDPATLTGEGFTLFGPAGVVKAKIVTAESNLLAFIVPEASLLPGSRYTVFVQGVAEASGKPVPFTVISFNTRSVVNPTTRPVTSVLIAPVTRPVDLFANLRWRAGDGFADDAMWRPSQGDLDSGSWHDTRAIRKRSTAALPEARAGVTAVTGRVLRLDGQPLVNVSMKFGEATATTDDDGVFLLENVKAGFGVLEVNGEETKSDEMYGFYQIRVKAEQGRTTPLKFDIWLTKLDVQGNVKISSPTTAETIVTTPAIPGLELRIPPGAVIRGRDGKIVTEINITAIPTNRSPFPLPEADIPVYFTIQPGGAWIQGTNVKSAKGAQLYYPNYRKGAPGSRGAFYNYDPRDRDWFVYGEGEINRLGTHIVPDAGTVIHEFNGAMMFNANPPAPPEGPPAPPRGLGNNNRCCPSANSGAAESDSAGDPVSTSTGYFLYSDNDIELRDVVPISVERTYRSQDTYQRTFGIGWVSLYDTILWSNVANYPWVDLILPNGARVHFVRISSGTSFDDAVFETTAQGQWYKARVERNNARGGWDLVFRDGARWYFHAYERLKEMTDASGNTVSITRRDGGGNAGPITRVQSPNGRFVNFTLDTSGRVTQATDNAGRSFSYEYDASGRLWKVTDPFTNQRIYTYDSSNRLLTVKDPRGIVTVTNVYDTNGRVSQQTLADGNTFQFAYTVVSGKVTQTDVTDQRGKVRRVGFNSSGHIMSSIAAYGTADAQQTTFGRDSNGQLTSISDPLGRVTSIAYDGWGNPTTVTRLYGTSNAVTTTYAYTSGGERVASFTDALYQTSSFTYDARWNLLTVTDPLSHTVTYTRDTQGRALTMTDALSHTWTYVYSGPDLVSVSDPLGRTTQLFADSLGRVTRTVDPLGNASVLEYDALDRVTRSTDALGGVVQFGFDANGNMTTHLDQKNNTTTYAFNNLNLASSKTDALTRAESYLYAPNGKVSQITDRRGQVSGVAYDNLNRASQIGFGATVANPTTYASTLGYTYDAGNRMTQIADSVGGTLSRAYDGLDNLTQEQTPEGTVTYTFDAARRRVTMSVAGQAAVSYTWDNADRLTQIQQGTDVIAFAYDNANRRTSTTLGNGVVMAYGYDSANQLTSITYTKGATTIGDLQYASDAAGRTKQVSGSLAATSLPAAIRSAIYNANNQLTSWMGVTQTYDLNGNLTSDGINTYTWNARDQLASISGGVAASFVYDGAGRRKSKTIAGTQTSFLYDGLNFVQELSGSTPTANLITGGIDELFQRKVGSTTSSAITDALGSVIGLTDSSGTLQTQYSFEPYGKTTATGAANSNTQTFTSREDDTTGLFFYRARYYSPRLQRFIREDPLGVAVGPNLYMYGNANPTNFTDPTGLASEPLPPPPEPGKPYNPPKPPPGHPSHPVPEPPKPQPKPPGTEGAFKACMIACGRVCPVPNPLLKGAICTAFCLMLTSAP